VGGSGDNAFITREYLQHLIEEYAQALAKSAGAEVLNQLTSLFNDFGGFNLFGGGIDTLARRLLAEMRKAMGTSGGKTPSNPSSGLASPGGAASGSCSGSKGVPLVIPWLRGLIP
jgi:hypothetical protein